MRSGSHFLLVAAKAPPQVSVESGRIFQECDGIPESLNNWALSVSWPNGNGFTVGSFDALLTSSDGIWSFEFRTDPFPVLLEQMFGLDVDPAHPGGDSSSSRWRCSAKRSCIQPAD